MAPVSHRVRRMRWHIRVGTEARALEVRRELRARLDDVILTALGHAFDASDLPGTVVHIPKLTLDLRIGDGDGDDLVAKLAERIESGLRAALARAPSAPAVGGPVRRVPAHADARDVLLAYLATGRIPWHALTAEPSDPSPQAVLGEAARALAESPEAPATLPGGSLEARRVAAFRWLLLLDPPSRAALVRQAARLARRTGQPPVREWIRRTLASPAVGDVARTKLEALLLAIREEDLTPGSAGRVMAAFRELAPARLVAETAPEPRPDASVTTPPEVHLAEPGPESSAQAATPPVSPDERSGADAVEGPSETPGLFLMPDAGDTPDDVTDGLIADDAGLVLLHPYLPRLFAAVGVAREGRRIAGADLPRAGALLHWLVSGRSEVFEYELTVVKVLLGLTPIDPLLVAPALIGAVERSEADAMLAAAIDHWGALGRTSVAGLRASFLRRRGLVWEGDEGWRLRVEPRGFDVLLGRLPWGFKVVKLPWMNRPMFIEWPTH